MKRPLPRGRFYGSSEAAVRGPDLVASVSSYAPGTQIPKHVHSDPYISVVVNGSYVERVGAAELECTSLTVRYHPAEEEHADHFGPLGGECLNIELGAAWAPSLEVLPTARCAPLSIAGAGPIGVRAIAAYRQPNDDGILQLESAVADLLGAMYDAGRISRAVERSAAVMRARDYIHSEITRPLSLTDIAAVARLHPTHFARSFRALTGHTVGEYVRRERVKRVQAELKRSSTRSLSQIAVDTGFADHAHLTRVFRQTFGLTPSAFRSLVRTYVTS